MLTIWSCCMAYFFGFFGISFVDKDEDLLMEFEHTPWEPTNVEELPRTLGSIAEDTGAMTHTPSQTTPRALSTNEEEPVQDALRHADDAERVAAVLARSRSLKVDVVGPISIDGRETLVPLADYDDIARLVKAAAPACCGWPADAHNSGRQDPGGRNRRLRRLPHAGNGPEP